MKKYINFIHIEYLPYIKSEDIERRYEINFMENSSASKLIAAFVLLIIGIVLIAQVADLGSDVTTKSGVAGESQELLTNGTALNTTGMIGAGYTIAESPSHIVSCIYTGVGIVTVVYMGTLGKKTVSIDVILKVSVV